MSWIDDFKKWFWGDLKPEPEPQFEKPKPIVTETTDEVLGDAVQQTVRRKRTAAKKPVEKKSPTKKSRKPRKPRKPKTENKK